MELNALALYLPAQVTWFKQNFQTKIEYISRQPMMTIYQALFSHHFWKIAIKNLINISRPTLEQYTLKLFTYLLLRC